MGAKAMAKIRTSPIHIAEFAALPWSSNNGGLPLHPRRRKLSPALLVCEVVHEVLD